MTRGRLVKKAEQEKLAGMHVDTYPWKDFSSESILLPDNPRRSVVVAKSHPQQELSQKVQNPAEFTRTFGAPAKPLFPEDMTAEFLASQEELRQRKRRMQMDEDEAVALELLDITDGEAQEGEVDAATDAQHMSPGEANADAALSVSKPGARAASGADISDLSKLAAQNNRGFGDGALAFGANQSIVQEDVEARIKEAYESGFAQGRSEGESAGYDAAMNEVASRATETAPAAAAPVHTFEEGVEQGLAQGRAQALQEAEEKYNHSVLLFTRALSELQHLKGELLSTGREIFAEIAQICAERVLRQSVKLNDEALRSVFESATGQFQRQDELKIEMHPEDIARIEPQLDAEQRKRLRLVGNSTLQRGDLKIEANNEVVSLDLHNTVQQVIDSLKDELFEPGKKDDSTEKAG
jgi:flagellar biosynthesis/type III secretory pathway protein FliH